MKIKTSEFKKVLDIVSQASKENNLIPEYGSVAIADNEIYASDGFLFFKSVLKTATGFSCMVNATNITGLVDNIKTSEFSIDFKEEHLVIKSGKLKGKLITEPVLKKFDFLNFIDEINIEKVLPKNFFDVLRLAKFSCSKEMSSSMSGISITPDYAYSTDRYRITRCAFDSPIEDSFILPANLIALLLKYSGSITTYGLSEDKNLICFKFVLEGQEYLFGGRLISAKYPPIEEHIKRFADGGVSTIVLNEDLLKAFSNHLIVYRNKPTFQMETDIKFDKGKLFLSSASSDFGELVEEVEVKGVEETFTFKSSPAFFVELIKQFPSVEMQYNEENATISFRKDFFEHYVSITVV